MAAAARLVVALNALRRDVWEHLHGAPELLRDLHGRPAFRLCRVVPLTGRVEGRSLSYSEVLRYRKGRGLPASQRPTRGWSTTLSDDDVSAAARACRVDSSNPTGIHAR